MTDAVIQIIMSFIISSAFSVMFNVRGKKVFINGAGGAISWLVYLAAFDLSKDLFWSFFASTATIALFCYILARIIKTPVTLMLVPMIVPLIPGGLLYSMVFQIIAGDMAAAKGYFYELVIELSAINLAIISVATLFVVIYSVKKYMRRP